jgi:hypothetical protein
MRGVGLVGSRRERWLVVGGGRVGMSGFLV